MFLGGELLNYNKLRRDDKVLTGARPDNESFLQTAFVLIELFNFNTYSFLLGGYQDLSKICGVHPRTIMDGEIAYALALTNVSQLFQM